ncbi:unnamed protein product, partial [Allacma fusca]
CDDTVSSSVQSNDGARKLIEELPGPSKSFRSPLLSPINEDQNLFNFEETIVQPSSIETSFDGMANLFQVSKISRKIPPGYFCNDFWVCHRLNSLYQAQSGDVSLDAEIKSLFVETYNHRTMILYDHSFEVLMGLYPCVENTKLIELEATTRYSLEIIMKMKANAKALIKAVQEFYFYTNYPISMQIFFQILNPNGGFFQIFTNPCKFYSDQPESTDLFPYINILLQKKKITCVKLLTLNMSIDAPTIEDALLWQILYYNLFDQKYPESRKKEFLIIEAFVFGTKPTALPENLKLYVERLSDAVRDSCNGI